MCLNHNLSIARLHSAFSPSLLHFNNDLISFACDQRKLTQVYLDAHMFKQMHHYESSSQKRSVLGFHQLAGCYILFVLYIQLHINTEIALTKYSVYL